MLFGFFECGFNERKFSSDIYCLHAVKFGNDKYKKDQNKDFLKKTEFSMNIHFISVEDKYSAKTLCMKRTPLAAVLITQVLHY